MEPFVRHTGIVAPLDRANVDTDQIIPKQFLKRVERTGFGEFLFNDWRYHEDGSVCPGFELNAPALQGASILVAGRNFGSGSSREHAPWALEDFGFRVIIAKSFADIFRGNSPKIGLLPVVLAPEDVEFVAQQSEAEVDLEAQEVRAGGKVFPFEFDPEIKHRLLNGLDDIALTLQQGDAIDAYEAERERSGPNTLQFA